MLKHTNEIEWTKTELDSLFERGSLHDWRVLYKDLIKNSELERNVIECGARHPAIAKFADIVMAVAQRKRKE